MGFVENVKVTFNVAILSVFYTMFGGILSYFLHYLFDEFDDKWKERSLAFQLADIFLELSIIGVIAYWLIDYIHKAPPIFHVSKKLDLEIDSYTSGIFFVFAMFIFLNDLTSKIQHIYHQVVGPHFEILLPNEGSIIDLSLRYAPRKTETQKHTGN
jgi:hypothetical protein